MNAVECLNVSFNRGSRMVLDDISLSVAQGEFVALIGHNGAGKSTLIKLCLGLITPKKGKVKVLGGRPGASPISVGYLPENVSFYDGMTIRDNLNYFADLKNIPRQRADELIESLGLSTVAAQKVGQCSKGQRQRLGLAQALLAKPKLLFLDEPTVGLDPTASDFMYQELLKLKERGCTVIVCTHELMLVEGFADRIVMLVGGHKAVDGTIRILSEKMGLSFELVSSDALNAARQDEFLRSSIIDGRLVCKGTDLSQKLIYLEKKYGITGVGVKNPSLMDIYKAALKEHQK